jgi:two-component system, cell cycle response regulator CtrA
MWYDQPNSPQNFGKWIAGNSQDGLPLGHTPRAIFCRLANASGKHERLNDMLPGSLGSLKIVVVDDDPMIRTVVGRCLIQLGASVTLCEDAAGGMRAIEEVRPHAVLLDLIMPQQDGFYLLRRIRTFEGIHNWRAGIVVITGLRDSELEQELKQCGVTYLPKPFTPRDLFNAVRQASLPFSLPEQQLVSVPNAV